MKEEFKAYAKINTVLDVTKKLPNGYHEIRTVMQTIDLHDRIVIECTKSCKNTITLSCENEDSFPGVKWDETNLIYKAAAKISEIFTSKTGECVKTDIRCEKNIPCGAGMGGGSADAAAVLKGMNSLLGLGLSQEDLREEGKKLGADVPFCLTGGTALCEGIGEIITPLCMTNDIYCVVLKPEVSISTGFIYEHTDAYLDSSDHPKVDAMVAAISAGDLRSICRCLGNFLEPAAVKLAPEINELERALITAGACGALMTGSGSAVFGLFADHDSAKKAFDRLSSVKARRYLSKCI